MDTFSISKLSAFLADMYDKACCSTIDYFQSWMLQYLQSYIVFDSATWGIFNVEDTTPRISILFNIPDDFVSSFESFKASDRFVGAVIMNPGKALNSIDYDLTSLPEYLGLYEKYNLRYVLSMELSDEKMRVQHAFSIIRADKNHPFSENERRFIQAVSPHLIQARRINCQFYLNTCQAHATFNQPFKMALVDYQGGVQQTIQGFEDLIKREWEGWYGNTGMAMLPSPLMDQLITNRGESYTGNHIVVTASYFEYLVALQVRTCSPIDVLTLREREVAILCAQGRNQKEIAAALNISPFTVRNHLQKIYSSLNINNKAQLAKRLLE